MRQVRSAFGVRLHGGEAGCAASQFDQLAVEVRTGEGRESPARGKHPPRGQLAGQGLVLLGFDFQHTHLHQLGSFHCQLGAFGVEPGGVRLSGFVTAKHDEAGF
jgi:hypothetical protein